MLHYGIINIGGSVHECMELMWMKGMMAVLPSRLSSINVVSSIFVNSLGRVPASWARIRDGQQLGSIKMPLKFKEFGLQRGEMEGD